MPVDPQIQVILDALASLEAPDVRRADARAGARGLQGVLGGRSRRARGRIGRGPHHPRARRRRSRCGCTAPARTAPPVASSTTTAAAGSSATSTATTRCAGGSAPGPASSSSRSTTASRPSTRARPRRDDAWAALRVGGTPTPASSASTPSGWRSAATSAGGNLAALMALRARDDGRPGARPPGADLPGHRPRDGAPVHHGERRGLLPHRTTSMHWFAGHYLGADRRARRPDGRRRLPAPRRPPRRGRAGPGGHRRVRPAPRRGRRLRGPPGRRGRRGRARREPRHDPRLLPDGRRWPRPPPPRSAGPSTTSSGRSAERQSQVPSRSARSAARTP